MANEEKKIPARLLKGMSEEEKEDFEKSYWASSHVTDKITEVVESMLKESYQSSEKLDNYEKKTAWSEYQADQIGFRRGIKKVLQLLP